MAFADIQVLQSTTASGTTVGPDSAAAMTVDLSLTGVTAGSTLLVVGTMFLTTGWPYAKATSVASSGDTWSTPVKLDNGFSEGDVFYSATRSFYAVAANVGGGNDTVTVSFNGADPFNADATESVPSTKGVQYRLALIEIGDARTAAPIDTVVTKRVVSGTTTAVTTGVLAQTDNIQVWVHGLNTSYSGVPSGFTSLITKSNGEDSIHGAVVAHRKVTSATSTTVTQTHGSVATAVGGFLITLRAADSGGGSVRYKFLMDTTNFTSSDTAVEVHVWRNSEPYTGTAERYTGLTGDAVAGTLYVTTDLPPNVSVGDTIKAAIFNATDASVGYVTGTVESY